MRKFLVFFCCLVLCGSANSQTNVVDLGSTLVSIPVGKKDLIIDAIYKNGVFHKLQKRKVRGKVNADNNKKVKKDYDSIGEIIDSLKLIDYKSDTIIFLTEYHLTMSSSSDIIKTKKDTFYFFKNEEKRYDIRYVDMKKKYTTWIEGIEATDYLLYKAVFSWDINMLIELLKSSSSCDSDYYMSATRIILKDNQAISRETVYFKPAMVWEKDNI